MRPKAFLVASQRFHLEAVGHLHNSRLDVQLVCARPTMLDLCRRHLAGALAYDSLAARAGDWPEGDERSFAGVAAAILEELAPYETAAKNMIDRWNWTGASAMAIHRVYLRYIEIWETYLRQLQPDVVIFHGEPHRGFDWVLYGLCHERRIPTPIVTFTLLSDRLTIREAIEDVPGPTQRRLAALVEEAQTSATAVRRADADDEAFAVVAPPSYYMRDVIPKERDVESLREALPFRRVLLSRSVVPKFLELFQRYPATFPNVVPDSPVSHLHRKIENVRVRRRIRKSLEIYEAAARKPDLDRPFLYYPIHFQPEATTIPLGGVMYHELNNLRLLSAVVPEGWVIMVKEHPQMWKFSKEWPRARGTVFYEDLQSIPKVVLAPAAYPSGTLTRHARLVATTTGSAGWEAILQGKFVMVFGYPWYGRCPGAVKVESAETCAAALELAAGHGFRNDERLVQAFIDEFTAHHSFLGGWDDSATERSTSARQELVEATAEGIDRWIRAAAGAGSSPPPLPSRSTV